MWHGLAKLRLHTDSSLTLLDTTTKDLARRFRQFRDTTSQKWKTFETKREARLRRKREAKQNPASSEASTTQTRRAKILNLLTYKFHSLGDYVATIRWLGTTDNYSTQIVCSRLFLPVLCH